MSTSFNTTLDSPALDAQIAKLDAVSTQTTARVRSLLNHAPLLVAGLIVFTLAGVLIARRATRTSKP